MMARGASVDFSAQPPSPALTNPDLILPFNQELLGFAPSPPRSRRQPPSPPDSDQMPGIWKADGTRLGYSLPLRSSPPHVGRSTYLQPVQETELRSTRTTSAPLPDSIVSSSKIEHAPTVRLDPSWRNDLDRRWSNGSGSVRSDEIENMHWPGFEGPSDMDDESVVLDGEADGSLTEAIDDASPPRSGPHPIAYTTSIEDDPLSRRADMILANAKKRLHAMEGNLRGARNSLLISAPSSPSSVYRSEHSNEVMKERPRYGSAAAMYSQPRLRFRVNPQDPESGHNRMLSDGSSGFGVSTSNNLAVPKRPSSALGSFAKGLSSIERATSLRGVRSQQDMRDSRLQDWIEESTVPDDTAGPTTTEEQHPRTLPMESIKRPASAAGNLRSQMDELKGRISSLKARATEDRVKRLSTSPGATPSPLTNAERTHKSSDSYRSAASTTAATRSSPGQSPGTLRNGSEFVSPTKTSPSPSDEDSESVASRGTTNYSPKYVGSTYEDAEEALDNIEEVPEEQDATEEASTLSSTTMGTPVVGDEQKVLMGPQNPTDDELGIERHDPPDYARGNTHEYEHDTSDLQSLDGQSVYFEAPAQIAERHEDRADAFDYQNFFLHSAMGTYSRDRSPSVSSEGSNETTRPSSPKPSRPSMTSKSSDESEYPMTILEASPPPSSVRTGFARLVEASPGGHRRSQSVESISTIASFQTATEGGSPDSDEVSDDGHDPLEAITQRLLSPPLRSPILESPERLVDPAVHFLPSAAAYGQRRQIQKPIVAAMVKVLLQSEVDESKGYLSQDVELLEGLISTLQGVVSNLQSQQQDYDRRPWRRRLDAARRALETDE